MKFKPLLATDLSGHLGGIVASHNTYGPYFRQRVAPVNQKTIAQLDQRSALAYVAQTWRSLDPSVQSAWKAAAITKTSRSGDRTILTGQAAWMYVNTIRRRIGLSIITSPPAGTPGAAMSDVVINFTDASTMTLEFNGSDEWNGADGGVIVSAGLIVSPGVTFKNANLAAGYFPFPGATPQTLHLPFAVPIGGTVALIYHATGPDGRQSLYKPDRLTNPSFPPPPPALRHVLEVTLVGTKKYLWRFDGPVTCTPGADTHLVIAGDSTGTAAQAGPNNVEVTYGTANTTPAAWSIAIQPTTIAEAVLLPQAGTTD